MYIDSGVYKLENVKEYYHAIMTGLTQKNGGAPLAAGSANLGIVPASGKTIQIDPCVMSGQKDLTVAGNWFLLTNASTLVPGPTTPMYFGNLILNTFVQAFTSGTLTKLHSIASLGAALSLQTVNVKAQAAIGAVEAGDFTDAKVMIDRFQNMLFADAVQTYGVGAAPVGTIRTIYNFVGWKIYYN